MQIKRTGTVTFDRKDIVRILRREAQIALGTPTEDVVETAGGVYDARRVGKVILPNDMEIVVEFQ